MIRRCAVVVAVALALGVADRHVVASPQELIDAVRKGDKELVARLLADGAAVKVTRNQGLSALGTWAKRRLDKHVLVETPSSVFPRLMLQSACHGSPSTLSWRVP
jgi:hypothetical protein